MLKVEDCHPLVTLSIHEEITPELLRAADTELRNSPNLVAYLQKIHLLSLAEIGKIGVVAGNNDELKSKYALLRGRLDALEGVFQIPALAQEHETIDEE